MPIDPVAPRRPARAYAKGELLPTRRRGTFATMESMLVAVVDDEAPVRVALGRLLRLAGYEASAFESGEKFLASLANSLPACVLLDVNMPGLGGLHVQARLVADRVALPVVFITASDDPTIDLVALEAGAVCVLHKPFRNEELLAAVRLALSTA